MIVSMKIGASEEQVEKVVYTINQNGLTAKTIIGEQRIVIAVIGLVGYNEQFIDSINCLPGVEATARISKPYKLAAKEAGNGHKVTVGEMAFGHKNIFFMAGPCSVEDKKQMEITAKFLSDMGVRFLRAGAFKP